MNEKTILKVENLKVYFPVYGGFFRKVTGFIRALEGVSFSVEKGEVIGVVGESGCGKSTLLKSITMLIPPTEGEIVFSKDGNSYILNKLSLHKLIELRPFIQIVFQDPFSSLNPRMRVWNIISEPLQLHTSLNKKEIRKRVEEVLTSVGLNPSYIYRFPHQFSGGERQRIAIARALILKPSLLLLDEPTSALDVSLQAQVLTLLEKLKEEYNLTYILVSHNLGVVKYLSHRILIMYLGRIMESGQSERIFFSPLHPYTEALIQAIPSLERKGKRKIILKGEVPNPASPPSGCVFHPRCPYKKRICEEKAPELREISPSHQVACHMAEKLKLSGLSMPTCEV